MDLLRTCYETEIRPYPGSNETVRIRWHCCHPNAKPLPFYHRFASGVWASEDRNWEGTGEVLEAGRRLRKCECPEDPPPVDPPGPPDDWNPGPPVDGPKKFPKRTDLDRERLAPGVRMTARVARSDRETAGPRLMVWVRGNVGGPTIVDAAERLQLRLSAVLGDVDAEGVRMRLETRLEAAVIDSDTLAGSARLAIRFEADAFDPDNVSASLPGAVGMHALVIDADGPVVGGRLLAGMHALVIDADGPVVAGRLAVFASAEEERVDMADVSRSYLAVRLIAQVILISEEGEGGGT